MMDFATVAIVGAHFEKKRSTAMGLVFSGTGFGSLLFAPLLAWLTEYYGFWKSSMLIAAGLFLNCAVLSLVYSEVGSAVAKPAESMVDTLRSQVATPRTSIDAEEILKQSHQVSSATQTDDKYVEDSDTLMGTSNTDQEEAIPPQEKSCWAGLTGAISDWMDVSVLTNYVYIVFNLSNFIMALMIRNPYVYVPHLATEFGLATERESSYFLVILGVANTLGRLVWGALADKTSINRLYIFIGILIVNGLANFAISLMNNYYPLAIYCFVFGVTYGEYNIVNFYL